jgi:hypothetical protein
MISLSFLNYDLILIFYYEYISTSPSIWYGFDVPTSLAILNTSATLWGPYTLGWDLFYYFFFEFILKKLTIRIFLLSYNNFFIINL